VALVLTDPPAPIYGDTDCDGDVDGADYLVFEQCLTGPLPPAAEDCDGLDANADDRIDLIDFHAFQAAFTG
jgi:hypothetical protein